jgi:streptogramin lyase
VHSRVPLTRGRASSKALFASALLASLLCACGGSSPILLPAQAVSPAFADTSDARTEQPGDAKLDLRVLIPRGSSRADYISRSTQSIVVTEGKRRLRPVNTVTPSRNCSVQRAGTLCVFHLGVMSGRKEVFVIKTYDLKHGHGNLLSTGRITKRIRRGALNVLAVTLAGVPRSIELALQGAQLSAGTAGTEQLNVMAKDADGNVIVGAGSFRNPIAIVTNDTQGSVAVSPSTVTAPNQTVTLSYDGRSVESVEIAASSAGVAVQNVTGATFAPKPTVIADFSILTPAAIRAPYLRPFSGTIQQPTAIASGPDGNLWAAVSNTKFGLVRVSTSGVQTFYESGKSPSTNLPAIAITGLAAASDGNVWYVDNSDIGFISPSSGNVTDFPLTSGGVCPGPSGMRIVAAPASYGGVWATLQCASNSQIVHVTTNGAMTFYTLPGFVTPKGLAVGRDGNLYVAGQVAGNTDAAIAQAVVSGSAVVSSSVHDIASVSNLGLVGIAQSADGDIWATTGSCAPSAFIRLHTASTFAAAVADVFTTFGCSRPYYLTALPDGSLWAPDNAYAGAARITPAVYPAPPAQFDLLLPTPGGAAGAEFDVVLGPDGDLYFSDDSSTATAAGDIAKVAY